MPDLGLNCLQRLSADDTRRLRVNNRTDAFGYASCIIKLNENLVMIKTIFGASNTHIALLRRLAWG